MTRPLASLTKLPPETFEIGYASLEGIDHPDFVRFPYGISIARKLPDAVMDGILRDAVMGPTREYIDLYHEANRELNDIVADMSAELALAGIDNLPVPATMSDDELDDSFASTLRCGISHKMIATRAGLGWIGKTDLLVTKRFGPRVRLASVLTAIPAGPSGIPVEKSLCGKCAACVSACPARAATGKEWSVEVDRDDFYDAFKCRSFCRTVTMEKLGEDMSVCGICVAICPRGEKP